MKSVSFMYLFVYYLFFNHVHAQFRHGIGMWGGSFTGNSNLGVSNQGMSSSSGFLDPVQSVKQAMAKASVNMNPMNTFPSPQQIMARASVSLDPMSVPNEGKSSKSNMNLFDPIQPVQVVSKSSFNVDPMRFENHDQRLQSEPEFFNPSQSVHKVFIKSSTNRHTFRTSNGVQTETPHNNPGAFSTRNPVFPSLKRGSFGPAIASVPGAFDLAVSGITVKNIEPAPGVTQAPKEQPADHNTPKATGSFRQEAFTTPSTIKLLVKGVKEVRKETDSTLSEPICIQIPDTEYNTLCLMKTKGINETREKHIIIPKFLNKKETVKETFIKADNLVSIIAQGVCAFCCHASPSEQNKCFKLFCKTKTNC
ncbi:uncharacterized protein LOC125681498 isoform X2 [Ostrea edulis]|uniref:uncharacterized protein LOC125681498 isoform X2 n=1 Tax=Ostrea edulis TaxID=37623 RepID=UPI002096339F|nr:uncharacterized protein LOC125681498 isoform X2 [Ostrea edulis]